MELFKDLILQNLPSGVKNTRKCISFNCPCCTYMGEPRNDVKGRGGLFIEGDHVGYNCFNCGFSFRQYYDSTKLEYKARKFMELIGVPSSDINRISLGMLKTSYSSRLLNEMNIKKVEGARKKKVTMNFKECDLPKGVYFLHDILLDSNENSDAFEAYKYAEDRGIENWPYLMWADNKAHRLNKRLIIPFIHNKKIVGYTARSFLPNCKKEDRYYTQNPNTGKYIFNIDSLSDKKKYILVNESPIDSILYDGVATMNFKPSQDQIDIINNSNAEKIAVPDLDGSAGTQLIDTAIKNKWSVFFPYWDNNFDLGKATQIYGRLFVLSNILNNKISNSIEIKVKKNLL